MLELEQIISKKIGKAIFDYKMIEENDRILVAVSGGKDSLTLLNDLIKRQKSFPIHYTLSAVHIETDFCTCGKESSLETLFIDWAVPYQIIKVNVLQRLKPGRKMNCYWCSTQRRMELLKLAAEKNFNKIALGHHLDDIIETFMMNVCFKAEISAMLPVMKYDKYEPVVIRPLAYVKEELIRQFIIEKPLNQKSCNCPYSVKSKRKHIKSWIDNLAKDHHMIRENIFHAMQNINQKYL